MSEGSIEDRLAITELVNTAIAAVMRKDIESWGATWAEDGAWKIDMLDQPARGREAIVAIYKGLLEKFAFVSMTGFCTEIVVDGDRATGKAYSQELMFPKDGGQRILCGCFHDEYVRRDGRWHFLSRVYETLYRSTIIPPPA